MNERSDQPQANEEDLTTVRNAVNFDIVGDNIADIASFAIEKHEFRTGATLSPEMREAATAKAKEVLWQQVEELKLRRKKILAEMFASADKAVEDVVGK